MNTTSFPQIGLFLHIIGLTTVAGTTLASYITMNQFRNLYTQDKQKGFAVMQVTSKLPRVAQIGLLLLILSGIMMVAASHGLYGQQLWFRIKMVFVILVIAGSILMRRSLDGRLRKQVLDDMVHGNKTDEIGSLVSRIAFVQLFLLSFFIIIFIL